MFQSESCIENTFSKVLTGCNLNSVLCSDQYIDLVSVATWIKAGKFIGIDKRKRFSFLVLNLLKMKKKNSDYSILVPTHLAETLRYKTYTWNKKADILRLASQVANKKSDHLSFLGYPLE